MLCSINTLWKFPVDIVKKIDTQKTVKTDMFQLNTDLQNAAKNKAQVKLKTVCVCV